MGVGYVMMALAIGLQSVSRAQPMNADPRQPLLRPDDKTPDRTRKVKVFILMGPSNMVGMGDILPEDKPATLVALTKKDKYPFLVGEGGSWTVCKDFYYCDARVKKCGLLSALSNNGKHRASL